MGDIPYHGYSGYSGTSSSIIYTFTSSGYTSGVTMSYANEIRYQLLPDSRFYNLAFGVLKEDGSIDDSFKVNSDNPRKILGTVVKTVIEYLNVYPDRLIKVEGSDRRRTELYNRIITHKFDEISKFYTIYGKGADGGWHDFIPGTIYPELIIKKKE